MVKFVSLSLVMAAIASMSVMAQDDPEASSSVSSTGSASATQAPSSTGAPAASSTMTSASSSSAAGGDNDSDSNNTASGVCSILVGDPYVGPNDCTFSSTYTPPFDQSSIISYLIGGYQAGVEATPVDHVASSLAGDVIKYYPTLTFSKAQLAGDFKDALSASIEAVRDDPTLLRDAGFTLPANTLSYLGALAAAVAGAAIVL